jgi:predicted lipoprotein with Yx(FWY)xxD motif
MVNRTPKSVTSLSLRLIAALSFFAPWFALAQDALPPDVGVVEMGAGRLFVDQQGFTLYTYKRDGEQPGASVCIDACATAWPPVIAAEGATPVGEWAVIQRPDGARQWAHQAMPVYRYAKDTHPGATSGEKASGFWDVLFEPVATPPGISISASHQGQMLVDHDSRALYTNVLETCQGACLEGWRAMEAPWLAQPINSDWTISPRQDGSAQWTYKNQALFTYTGTEALDDDHSAGQGWQPVVLQAAPALPDWVTFQETDFGPVLADEDHMTLYYIVSDLDEIALRTCDVECEKEHWKPVIAPPSTEPIGNWSTLQLTDGTLQWVYLGRRVFTYRHDNLAGDINGDKFASGANIRAGWQAILKDTLTQKLF